jgi:hypothetical protein
MRRTTSLVRQGENKMAMPVVPSQFETGKNKIVHKPTRATFSLQAGSAAFKSVDWGKVDEQSSTGQQYRKEDLMRVAQQLLAKLPK